MVVSDTTFPADLLSTVEKNMVTASRLAAAQFRLDAPAFLSRDELSALMLGTSRPLTLLAEVSTVYIQSPILAYVSPFAKSRPYMTTSELAEYQTGRSTHVSLVADPRLIGWQINKGNIIVSRSGRVGEAYWVDKKLDGALVGDSFRVVPRDNADGPFIYAVLASQFARDFLSGSAYGSVVDHASLDQLRNFPLPNVSQPAKATITTTIDRMSTLREEAYDHLDEAQKALLRVCKLPHLEPNVMSADSRDMITMTINASELTEACSSVCEFRLGAHFYNPFARTAIANILKSAPKKRRLGEVSHDVIMGGRSKRNYVESAYGTPFLSGKNIVQIRQTDLKHVSNSETEDLNNMLLKRGWILVTRSGTVGRSCFVWDNFEDYAASEHILRVLPNEAEIDAGYLYAFLASEYGYQQMIRFLFGSVIDEIADHQLKKVFVPLPSPAQQKEIGNQVRLAYEKRAEALRLENDAQAILLREIKRNPGKES